MGWNRLIRTAVSSGGSSVEKSHFIAATTDTVTISGDAANPSTFTGLQLTSGSVGFSIRTSDGAVQNISGRQLGDCIGTISFQPNKEGGGTSIVSLSSQLSADGTSWTANPNSLRVIEVSNNGETFKTAVSLAINWPDQYYIRFVAYETGGGSIDFESPTDTVDGNVIVGASVVWELSEQ